MHNLLINELRKFFFIGGMPVGQEYIKSDLLGVFRGILAEQFVGQEILAGSASEIYYW